MSMEIKVVSYLVLAFLWVATLAPLSCWTFRAAKYIAKNGWGKTLVFAWDYIMDGVEE